MEQTLRHPALRTERPSWKRNWQYRHGERTKAAIAEQQKFSASLKMLRAGWHEYVKSGACAGTIEGQAARRLDDASIQRAKARMRY